MKRYPLALLGVVLVCAAAFAPVSPDATMALITFGAALLGCGSLLAMEPDLPEDASNAVALAAEPLPEDATPRGVDAVIERYLASDAEDADAILEADLDAVLRPDHAAPDALARNVNYYTPEEIKDLADRRVRQAREDARRKRMLEISRRVAPPTNAAAPTKLSGGAHRKWMLEPAREPAYAVGSLDPIDYVEVPRA